MKWILMSLMAALCLAAPPLAEDYQCGSDAGCVARHTVDGELEEVTFRKGDMVSTDALWTVSTDDGWVKVKTGPRIGGNRKRPGGGQFVIGDVMLIVGGEEIVTGTYAFKPPTLPHSFLRPLVSLAAQPPAICLIGL